MAAENAAQTAPDDTSSDLALVDKIELLAKRYAAACAVAHQIETEEGLSRTRLGLALADALRARADIEREARLLALAGYRAASAQFIRPRRRGRLSQRFEKALDRLRSLGRAVVIARSGLWDPAAGGLRAMAAYARRGPDPNLQPAALFDQAWYLDQRPDLAGSGKSPLAHFLLFGGADGASPHPLFDTRFYAQRNGAALAASGLTALEHYVRVGAFEGRDPHPAFSIEHYARQAPELISEGGDPLRHYLTVGWRRNLSPHPLFAPTFYIEQMRASGAPEGPPLVHYLTQGSTLGLRPHPLFDPDWYRGQNPEIAEGGVEPLSHYIFAGGAEGRHPSPWFDAPRYIALRGEDLAPGANPLIDYLQGGAWSISEPWPGRATIAFLEAASELASVGMTPLEHWARQSGAQAPSA